MGTVPNSVAVTGALGGAGRWVVDGLVDTSADVLAIDRRVPASEGPPGVDFRAADLTDRGETCDLLDALLGDVPAPCDLDGEEPAFSMTKAESELDWTPSRTWRRAADEPIEGPAFG